MDSNYSMFAKLYDRLFDLDLYRDWDHFVQANVDSRASKRVLDLAGGSGRLAVLLAKQGYQTTLLDLSSEMLSLASQHAEENHVRLDLIQADMTDDWPLVDSFPLITSFADSLNYLPDLQTLQQTLIQVFHHLKKGGKFLFDVITPYQVKVGYDNYMYNNDDDPTHIFMWTSFPGDDVNSVDHDLKFFVYDDQLDAFKLVREIHHEQTYPIKKYITILEKIGFTNIKVTADFGRSPVSDQTTRVFFSVEKA